MAFTLTPTDESGNYEISQTQEHQPWHRGITYGDVDEVTGQRIDGYQSGWQETDVNAEVVEPAQYIQNRLDQYLDDADPEAVERNQQYLEALQSLHPSLTSAVQWAASNSDPEFVSRYNQALDTEDWGTLNELVERLVKDYQEAGGQDIVEPTQLEIDGSEGVESILNELSESTQQLIKDQMDPDERADLFDVGRELLGAEGDASLANEQMQLAEQSYQQGDADAALLYGLSAQFHTGNMSAQEAVMTAIKKMGVSNAYNAYLRLQQGDPDAVRYGR